MKVQLTIRQISLIVDALEDSINPNYPDSESTNASIIRIINKLNKELPEWLKSR